MLFVVMCKYRLSYQYSVFQRLHNETIFEKSDLFGSSLKFKFLVLLANIDVQGIESRDIVRIMEAPYMHDEIVHSALKMDALKFNLTYSCVF